MTVNTIPPWEEIAYVSYSKDLTTKVCKKDTKDEQKKAALRDIEMINAETTTECREGGMRIRYNHEDMGQY